MDKHLVARKLDSLAHCIARIEEKRPESAAALATDVDRQDILSINLERAVQLCVDIAAHLLSDAALPPPETMGDVFRLLTQAGTIPEDLAASMRRAVGFRNLSVHAYEHLDWEQVFRIVHHNLDDFRKFAARAAEYVKLNR